MNLLDVFTIAVAGLGVFFFFAGSLGVLRFPDVFTRMHALTKADNVGLGLIVLGLLPQVNSVFDGVQLLITWFMVMIAGAVGTFLIANYALKQEFAPVSKGSPGHRGAGHEH